MTYGGTQRCGRKGMLGPDRFGCRGWEASWMLLDLLRIMGLLLVGTPPMLAAPFAYITNKGSDTVSVIDTATNTVTATVTVGEGPVAFG